MTNHLIWSNTLIFFSSAVKSKQMTKRHNDNNEDSSDEANYKSKRTLQKKELSKVLEALESLGFRPLDYHEK
jgi:hypothetical protein